MKKYVVHLLYVGLIITLTLSCNNSKTVSVSEADSETNSNNTGNSNGSNQTEISTEENTEDYDAARAEIIQQRMKQRQFDEEDQQQAEAQAKKSNKTYRCKYCNNEFTNGVDDKCMIMKDMHGNRIETGFDYLVGAGPAFCSQKCFDSFHEYKHEGHDVIY